MTICGNTLIQWNTFLTKFYQLIQNFPYYVSTSLKIFEIKTNFGKFIRNTNWITYFLTDKHIRSFIFSVQHVYLDYKFIEVLEIFRPTRLFGLHLY